jgi:glycosyltransferase involved in cell wall biosynthesis
MRVLLVNSFHYPRGGDCVHVLSLETLLRDAGHSVAFLAMTHPDNIASPWQEYWPRNVDFDQAGVAHAPRLLAASLWSLRAQHCMDRLMADFCPDVVHVHSVHHHLTLSVVRAAERRGVPVLWTLHDYRTVCPATHLLRRNSICERCRNRAFLHCVVGRCKDGSLARSAAAALESSLSIVRRTLEGVDCFVAPSCFLARKVLSMGLPARRVEVMRNFLPRGRLRSLPSRDQPRQGALYVGRLSREKGVDVLVRAWAGRWDVPLTIAGEGPLRGDLLRLAASVDGDVRFLGWLEHDDVRRHLQRCAVLCVPSACYENAPLIALEAMAEGAPVLVSDIGGLPEVVGHGGRGWIARAGDSGEWRRCLDALFDYPDSVQEKTAAASEWIGAECSWGSYAARLEALYLAVSLAKQRPGTSLGLAG